MTTNIKLPEDTSIVYLNYKMLSLFFSGGGGLRQADIKKTIITEKYIARVSFFFNIFGIYYFFSLLICCRYVTSTKSMNLVNDSIHHRVYRDRSVMIEKIRNQQHIGIQSINYPS